MLAEVARLDVVDWVPLRHLIDVTIGVIYIGPTVLQVVLAQFRDAQERPLLVAGVLTLNENPGVDERPKQFTKATIVDES
jgi:hypothetical protein